MLFDVWSNGTLSVRFGRLKRKSAPFQDETPRRELLNQLNQLAGVTIPEPDGRPAIPLELLTPQTVNQFLEIISTVAERIRAASPRDSVT